MTNFIKQKTLLGLKIILLAVASLAALLFYYFCCFISWAFDHCAKHVENLLIKFEILEQQAFSYEEANQINSEPLFTREEIIELAKALPSSAETIQDIQSFHNVSYRQARKIKSALDIIRNSPDIRRIAA